MRTLFAPIPLRTPQTTNRLPSNRSDQTLLVENRTNQIHSQQRALPPIMIGRRRCARPILTHVNIQEEFPQEKDEVPLNRAKKGLVNLPAQQESTDCADKHFDTYRSLETDCLAFLKSPRAIPPGGPMSNNSNTVGSPKRRGPAKPPSDTHRDNTGTLHKAQTVPAAQSAQTIP